MSEPGQRLRVLSQPQFADRVPQLARRSLMSVRGCLDALAAEVSITPLLSAAGTCYLITPGFAVVISDLDLVDEYGSPLLQPIGVERVVAVLNGGFTTLWTPIDTTADLGETVTQHAAARTAAASAALTHALRVTGGDIAPILPLLARTMADVAVPVGMLAQQAADDTDNTTSEDLATRLSALFTAAAELIEQLLPTN